MVKYASVQDIVADSDAPIYRYSPITRLLRDVYLVTSRIIPHISDIFLPLNFARSRSSDATLIGLLFQIILTIWSIVLYIPLLLLGIFIGGITPVLVGYLTAWPFLAIQGSSQVKIPARDSPVTDYNRRRNAKESWIFINGICTSRSGVQLIIRRLESLFQRPVTGILNRTLGPIVDLLECVIQRDISYSTESIREGFMETKKRLQDDKIDKVVLLCHSQGGIIVASILDQLMDDLSTDLLDKLEVYTFANAASHFSNPLRKSSDYLGRINYIEHYANGKDPVSQIGVLAFSTPYKTLKRSSQEKMKPNEPPLVSTMNRFNGRLFFRAKNSGHLLLSH